MWILIFSPVYFLVRVISIVETILDLLSPSRGGISADCQNIAHWRFVSDEDNICVVLSHFLFYFLLLFALCNATALRFVARQNVTGKYYCSSL